MHRFLLLQIQELDQEKTQRAILLASLTFFAAFLRFFKLGSWSFWVEEFHTINHTNTIDSLQKAILSVRPVFYLLEKPVFLMMGVSEWTARLVPALIGILTVPLIYWTVENLFGRWVAFLSAGLLAISPWHLYWSQNARFYTLFLVLFNTSLLSFYWGIEKDRFSYIFLSFTTMALAVLTHGLGVLLVFIFIAYYVLLRVLPFEKPAGLRLHSLLPFVLLALLGYAFLEAYIHFVTHTRQLYQILLSEFSKASASSWIGYGSPWIMLTSTIYYIGTPLALLALTGSAFLMKKKSRPGLLLSITAFGTLLMMILFTMFASTANRYVFMALPAWIILGAAAVQKFYQTASGRKMTPLLILGLLLLFLKDPVIEDFIYYIKENGAFRWSLALGLGVFFLYKFFLSLQARRGVRSRTPAWGINILVTILLVHPLVATSMYYAFQSGHRDNWKAAVEYIREEKEEGDRVVSSIPVLVNFYLNESVTDIEDVQLDTVLASGQRVWIIEDAGLNTATNNSFRDWAGVNCSLAGSWDQYTAGVDWAMRDWVCSP